MKIENRSATDINATELARRISDNRGVQRSGDRGGVGGSDRVEVSADAKLLTAALKASDDAPSIRQELVERMRAKLAAGEVGQDTTRLADRLIDNLIEP